MAGNQYIALRHIKASSVEKLERAMLQVNLDSGKEIKFHHIQFVDKKWYAFYYADWKPILETQLSKEMKRG